jgi:hypothetical protein
MEYLVDFDLNCDRSDAGIAPYIKAPRRKGKERRGSRAWSGLRKFSEFLVGSGGRWNKRRKTGLIGSGVPEKRICGRRTDMRKKEERTGTHGGIGALYVVWWEGKTVLKIVGRKFWQKF